MLSLAWWRQWWVVVAAWALVMASLYAAIDHVIARQAVPSQVEEAGGRALVLKRSRDGNFRLDGWINGQPVRMVIDTGASSVSIDASLAQRLGLPGDGTEVDLSTANGVTQGYEVNLGEVRLGDIVLRDLPADVSPHFGDPHEVLLGMSALKHLELSMQGDTLRISVPASQ